MAFDIEREHHVLLDTHIPTWFFLITGAMAAGSLTLMTFSLRLPIDFDRWFYILNSISVLGFIFNACLVSYKPVYLVKGRKSGLSSDSSDSPRVLRYSLSNRRSQELYAEIEP